ncbi:MAG: hypothetical protein EI684_10060 [Candidatus Viridilinea halotolerans]|uniref:Uncharacterized protein n=1 Tax=Candidatus Viridilinea halotolerans TaxID=2491704 RepID=A0A426U0J1_9CHLR|nr:MAG: hypothetical protein EI684_10060 [Candidatus Viridilinea halotolerans]
MILTSSEIIAQLEQRLAERMSAAALANWALATFYALEQGRLTVAETDAAPFAEVLDALMFADDARFALDEAGLRQMVARLQRP